MLGVPRFCESTLMCESGVWKAPVMMPATTEMSLGMASSTTSSRGFTKEPSTSAALWKESCATVSPRFRGW